MARVLWDRRVRAEIAARYSVAGERMGSFFHDLRTLLKQIKAGIPNRAVDRSRFDWGGQTCRVSVSR
jgi:hypothetical protein